MAQLTDTTHTLIGTWKLVSFQFEFENGERRDAYEKASGYLITDNARELSDTPSSLFDRMMAYSGRYRLQGHDCFIVAVDVAWHPSWIGTEQTRYYELDAGLLSIISPPQQHPKHSGQTIRGVIVWQRE